VIKNIFKSGVKYPSLDEVIVDGLDRPQSSPLSKIKHIVAIGSGKGGVGKSTVATSLAFALKKCGAKVGLIDADVYGPSVPTLMGISESPKQVDKQIIPPEINGIKIMSMALLGGDGPVIWRGPIASRAVNQFLGQVNWGELDYLLIDLPPGTGDIHLTLCQAAKVSGAVIVTTPQNLARDVAIKGLKMFQQLRVPIIGVVENMANFSCEQCGHSHELFSKNKLEDFIKDMDLKLLGSLPFASEVTTCGDQGISLFESDKVSNKVKESYVNLLKNMVSELKSITEGTRTEKKLVVNMEPNYKASMFKVIWNDGIQSLVSFKELRYLCPCAHCVDEGSGQRIIKKESVADNVQPSKVQTIGNYAVNIHWSDGHHTGIYSYDLLRKILVKK